MGVYVTALSSLAYVIISDRLSLMASMTVISPMPDLTALGLLFSSALIMNLKPHSNLKEGEHLSMNAYSSYL